LAPGAGKNAAMEPLIRTAESLLAGSALCCERGWLALHQMLATRPAPERDFDAMAGAQSGYPFNRSYMYPCSTPSSPLQLAT